MFRKITNQFRRRSFTTLGYDPTVVVSWTLNARKLRVELTEFFGDITCEVLWNGSPILFTSTMIHTWTNKLATKLYQSLEHPYLEDDYSTEEHYI